MICTRHQILFGRSNQELDGQGMEHVWGRGLVHIAFWWEILTERNHLEDPGADRRIIRCTLRKCDRGACTGLIWLRIGIGSGLL